MTDEEVRAARAAEHRELIEAVRAAIKPAPEKLAERLRDLPAEVRLHPFVQPFVNAILSGLDGLALPVEPASLPAPDA